MNKTFLVAKSEYLRRIRSKWFLIATVAVPLLAVAVFAVPMLAFSSDDDADRIAVIDEAGLADAVAEALGDGAEVEVSDAPLDTLRARVLADDLDGVLALPPGLGEVGSDAEATYYSTGGLGADRDIRGAVREAARRARAESAGASSEAIAAFESAVPIQRVTVREDGDAGDDAEGRFLLANLLSLLLYVAILIYGMFVMRGVIEEKANRIVEVSASSVRPFELLMGKVLGIGAVGLSQLVAWIVFSFGLSAAAGPILLALAPDTVAAGGAAGEDVDVLAVVSGLLAPDLLAAFLLFFVGGYLLYSSLFAAVGSAVDQESDAQSLQAPVILPIMIPVFFVSVVAVAPDTGLALFLSLFPLTSPIIMVVRMAVSEVPLWQVGLSLVLLAGAFVGMIWVAARIYRVGILMYGKTASFRDMARWIRTA